MKKLIFIAILFIGAYLPASAQHIPAYDANALMQRASSGDTLYVINFWATWCAPCVKELPCFDTLQARYKGKPVKVLLVSFDFKDSYPQKIISFINKKKVQPDVLWFTETNANEFIPKIESSWSGALPATLILQPSKKFRSFTEGVISTGSLSKVIDRQLGL
jgi:thiol-disulfide isomerase/thioredoxin